MEPTLAIVFLIASLGDMAINHCGGDGCLAASDAVARNSYAIGTLESQDVNFGGEFYYRHDFPVKYGPFQPAVGVSISEHADLWVGAGFASTYHFASDRWYVQGHLMPGLYARGSGPDLGHVIEFRSGLELGYEAPSGIRVGLTYDHRSNGSLDLFNPGLDMISLRVSIPTN